MLDRFRNPVLLDRAYVRCQTWDDVEPVAAKIPAIVAAHQSTEQLKVEVASSALHHVRKVAWWVEFFVYLSLSATLLLGGVGITNIMTAAVRARTREIGLKKAFGAEDRDILIQFLMESLWISLGAAFLGGILGRILIGILCRFIESKGIRRFVSLSFSYQFSLCYNSGSECRPLSIFAGKSDGSRGCNPL